LQPGQFVSGINVESKACGLSPREVRTCRQALETLGNLTIKTTNKFSVITVVNWAIYQDEEPETTSKTTSKRQASDKQATTNKNVKNVKNNTTRLDSSTDKKTVSESDLQLSRKFRELLKQHHPAAAADYNVKTQASYLKPLRSKLKKLGYAEEDKSIEEIFDWIFSDTGRGDWGGWSSVVKSISGLLAKKSGKLPKITNIIEQKLRDNKTKAEKKPSMLERLREADELTKYRRQQQ